MFRRRVIRSCKPVGRPVDRITTPVYAVDSAVQGLFCALKQGVKWGADTFKGVKDVSKLEFFVDTLTPLQGVRNDVTGQYLTPNTFSG